MIRPITVWEQLADALSDKKHNIARSFTNFYPDQQQFQIFLQEGRICLMETASVLWILRQEVSFQHMYFSCPTPDDLMREFDQVLPLLTAKTTVTSVARNGSLGQTDEVFLPLGFNRYSDFQRMALSVRKEVALDDSIAAKVSYALETDAPNIENLYLDSFDPLDDEIPSRAELTNYIKLREARVIRTPAGLGGCLITRANGKTSRFLYIVVSSESRGQGLASALMRDYLNRCAEEGILRSLLWVRDNNENALAYYRHFGYTKDGLLKRIYLIRK